MNELRYTLTCLASGKIDDDKGRTHVVSGSRGDLRNVSYEEALQNKTHECAQAVRRLKNKYPKVRDITTTTFIRINSTY